VLEPGRLFTLAVPAGYTGDESVPLVLALHYGGHGTPYFGNGVLTGLVEPALRELEAIIVAPDCSGRDWTDPQSEADVTAVLDHVESNFNIDRQRTLVTGYSMGGIGTWYLAGRYPDRFRAAAVVSGSPPEDVLDIDWEVPVYAIHSRDDDVVPIEPTEVAIEHLRSLGIQVEFVALSGIGHYETSRFLGPLRAVIPWLEDIWQR
jgi:predicted peptidase